MQPAMVLVLTVSDRCAGQRLRRQDVISLHISGDRLPGGRHRQTPAGLGRGEVDQGPEPRCCVHDHGEGGRDLADPEVHHLQSHPATGGRRQCQCPGGQSSQEVQMTT